MLLGCERYEVFGFCESRDFVGFLFLCMGTPFTAIKILLIRFVFLLKKKLSSTIVEAHKL